MLCFFHYINCIVKGLPGDIFHQNLDNIFPLIEFMITKYHTIRWTLFFLFS
uniref:Uncharacterized protein n=1 Tax=Rhizophora mucronata TaxID=61149 RepID=A0A2P2QGY9_RHIMU